MRRILKRKGKDFFPNKEAFTTSLKRKLIRLFNEPDMDRREWRMHDADIALHETGMQLQSRRMELYEANINRLIGLGGNRAGYVTN